MSYDAWKLASPDDEYYDDDPDEDCCDHEEYEADILTGRAFCCRCGHAWYQTAEEIEREHKRIRAHDEWQREQDRPWFRLKQWAAWKWKLRRKRSVDLDDELPF